MVTLRHDTTAVLTASTIRLPIRQRRMLADIAICFPVSCSDIVAHSIRHPSQTRFFAGSRIGMNGVKNEEVV